MTMYVAAAKSIINKNQGINSFREKLATRKIPDAAAKNSHLSWSSTKSTPVYK